VSDEIDWGRANCLGTDPEIFFNPSLEGYAKSICQDCDIQGKCLTWAIQRGEKFGVWGGMDEDTRNRVGTARSRVKCPGCQSHMVRQDAMTRQQVCGACGLSWKI
jgi:WhiB family redox-sensing transcriptional regulator